MIKSVSLLQAGYCTHPEFVVNKKPSLKNLKFPALFALIKHKKYGYILYDTGYTERFYTETKKFPFNLYAAVTPVYVKDKDSAAKQLLRMGIKQREVKYIIISHFHADHTGGLRDFTAAKFIYNRQAYEAVKGKRGLSAAKSGFISGFLPEDFEKRSRPVDMERLCDISRQLEFFPTGFDIFGDKSMFLVDLPGHAAGQAGLFLTQGKKKYFFTADACWLSSAYMEDSRPFAAAYFIMDSAKKYDDTLHNLHLQYRKTPGLKIIPSHCAEAAGRMEK